MNSYKFRKDYFWDDLQVATGGSHLGRIPNSGHAIVGVIDSLLSFYLSVCDVSYRIRSKADMNRMKTLEYDSSIMDMDTKYQWNSWTNCC